MPDDGMQPEPQFVPPHVRLAVVGTGVVEVVEGTGVVEVVVGSMPILHVAMKPRSIFEPSDSNVIMRKPAEDV